MEVEKPVITKEIQVIEKRIEVPVEVIVYKEVIKQVPIVKTEIKIERVEVEKIVYVDRIKEVIKTIEVPVETVVEKVVHKIIDRPIEIVVPSESTKLQEVIKKVEKPVEVIKVVEKIVEVPVEKIVYREKPVVKVIKEQVIKEVERKVDVPIISTKVEIYEKIVNKIVEKEVFRDIIHKEKDDKCMSEVNFVTNWNKLMNIKFSESNVGDECITEEAFVDLVVSSLKNNMEKMKNNL